MTCGIFLQFSKCEILMLGKFVSFIASCTYVEQKNLFVRFESLNIFAVR
jgi:hypothetical protein